MFVSALALFYSVYFLVPDKFSGLIRLKFMFLGKTITFAKSLR